MSAAPKPKRVRYKKKRKRNKQMQLDCIDRDGMCVVCGRIDDTLVGHHITSFGSGGDDELHNMITLCARCHGNVHQGFLDWNVLNPPMREFVELPEGFVGGVMSKQDKTGPRIWNADDALRRFMDAQ